MSSLIAMCTYDLEGSGRTDMTRQTLESLVERVDFFEHELYVHDNGSCQETLDLLEQMKDVIPFTLLKSETNIGTAKGINACWKFRKPDQFCVKIDNDVVIHEDYWVDLMEEAIQRDPTIGICCLKRRDLDEAPYHTDWRRSRLYMVPQEKGQRWIVVEQVEHAIGTVQMYNPLLLEKIGYLYQMDGVYSFDDSLAGIRAKIAGFKSVFYMGIDITHVDPGASEYTDWKVRYATEKMDEYNKTKQEYIDGTRLIYYNPFENDSNI